MNPGSKLALAACTLLVCLGQLDSAVGGVMFQQDQAIDVVAESREGVKCVVVRNLADPQHASLSVKRADAKSDAPDMLGTSNVVESMLVFKPRFPLVSGQYVVEVVTSDDEKPRRVDLVIKPERRPPARVTNVFPSADELPENTLKFYVHFSAPMQKGDIYEFVRLQELDGQEIELPFLEIEQEFWSRDSTRLTLLLDPGRIKRGLKPREEMGPILVSGKTYQLIIDGNWPDANGQPLGGQFVKQFRVGHEDHAQPDPKTWKINVPPPNSKSELVIDFPDALDHAMLMRVIQVVDSDGAKVPGVIAVSNQEKCWRLLPSGQWREGTYRIKIGENLEDNAGNSIGRPFDVDLFHQTQPPAESTTELRFKIRQ